MEFDLTQARRRAKGLLRAARDGDRVALQRMRADRTPRLADAQRAVAAELGFASWPALVEHAHARVTEREQRAGVLQTTDLSYVPGRPVRIRVRHRAHRYEIDDLGAAVAVAGRPPGWPATAKRITDTHGWNVNREGVLFVPAVEGRDIDMLVRRTAEVSLAVHDALLELETGDG